MIYRGFYAVFKNWFGSIFSLNLTDTNNIFLLIFPKIEFLTVQFVFLLLPIWFENDHFFKIDQEKSYLHQSHVMAE
jgi:hypothetical protein